jgi:hypothetical protein
LVHHPLGPGSAPDCALGVDCLLYRTESHPDGNRPAPEYEVRELST